MGESIQSVLSLRGPRCDDDDGETCINEEATARREKEIERERGLCLLEDGSLFWAFCAGWVA